MKKITWLLGSFFLLTITGCFDTKEEITIADDGSGNYVATADMGKILSLAKTMGAENKQMKEIENMKKDTTINLIDLKDSLPDLTEAEKKLLDKATLNLKVDAAEEILSFKFSFPFSKPSDITAIRNVLNKSKGKMLEDKMKGMMPEGEKDGDGKNMFDKEAMGKEDKGKNENSSVDNYYNDSVAKGKISRKLNKGQYAKVADDEDLKMLQQMSQMGMGSNIKIVINLPKAAKKAEGKALKLSNDRKQVTIEGTLDDFFEDGSYFEYEVEY